MIKKQQKNQRGFSVFELIILIALAALIGGAAWYVGHRNKPATKTENTSKTSQPISNTKIPADWTTYENKELGFKFAYPKEWGGLKDVSSVPGDGSNLKVFSIGIWKGDRLTANIQSSPKTRCPQGDGGSITISQGWYEKGGAYYVIWCKYAPGSSGNEYPVGFEGDTVAKINQNLLLVYNFARSGLGDSPYAVASALLNLSKNNNYSGLSLSRSWIKDEGLDNQKTLQEFKNVIATLKEL